MDVSFVTLLTLFHLSLTSFLNAFSEGMNLGFCADPSCSVPIGHGHTLQNYQTPDHSKLSFFVNEQVQIFVKDAGPKRDLLGVLIRERRGYVPKSLIREDKSYVNSKDLVHAQFNFLDPQISSSNVAFQEQPSSQWPSNQETQHFASDSYSNFPATGQGHSSIPSSASGYYENQGFHNYPEPHPQSDVHSSSGGHSHLGSWGSEQYMSESRHVLDQFANSERSNQFDFESNNLAPPSNEYNNKHNYMHQGNIPFGASNDMPYGFEPRGTHLETSFSTQPQSNSIDHAQISHHHEIGSSNIESASQSHNTIVSAQYDSTGVKQSPYVANSQYDSTGVQQSPYVANSQYDSTGVKQSPYVANSQYDATGVQQSPYVANSQYDSTGVKQSPYVANSQYDSTGVKQSPYVANSQVNIASPSQGPETLQPINSHESQLNLAHIQSVIATDRQHKKEIGDEDIMGTLALLREQGIDVDSLTEQYFSGSQNPSHTVHPDSSQFVDSQTQSSEASAQKENPTNSLQTDNTANTIIDSNVVAKSDEIHTPTELGKSSEKMSELVSNNLEEGEKEALSNDDDEDEGDDEDEVEIETEELDNFISNSLQVTTEKQDDASFSVDTNLPENENAIPLQSGKEDVEHQKNDTDAIRDSKPEHEKVSVQEPSPQPDLFIDNDHTLTSGNLPSVNDEEIMQKDISESNKDSSVNIANKIENGVTDNSELNDELASSSSESSFADQTMNNSSVTSESFSSIRNDSISKTGDISEDVIPTLSKTDETISLENNFVEVSSHNPIDSILDVDSVNETDQLSNKRQKSELDKILNISELSESEKLGYLSPYQIRNLKEENRVQENENVDENIEDNTAYAEFDLYGSIENTLEAVRSSIELLLSWIPEPLYSIIMDLHSRGISPRVPVFTVVCSMPCIFLIVAVVYIREKSNEKKLTAQLALSEKNIYTLSVEKNILEEKIEKATSELQASTSTLNEERSTYEELKTEIKNLKEYIQKTNQDLERSLEEIDALKEREKQYAELVSDHEKAHIDIMEEKTEAERKVKELEGTLSCLSLQLQEKEGEATELWKEKLEYVRLNEDYEEKLNQLQLNCNQLLTEAEVWNTRVNDLNLKLNEEISAKEEFESVLKIKETEIESLSHLVKTLKSFEELELTDEDEINSNKEKLQILLNSASLLIKLQHREEENKALSEKLLEEKNKILEMEVEILDAKSESDKLKLNYNQALQDKAEAQTKLEVLTNYFKDKEIQLQKQLGAHEAVREKREKDADSAERRICLIEQENASYKYQVASMKQEMEETERNLKSQIAAQEKKAHENWIAARAAERKLEDMKQEVTQLRQRLTLLEREQENWANASRDEVIRPVPKRISGINDDSVNSQDINNSMDLPPGMFPPPHPMMLPPDRPLPPLPPPHLPPFLPPPPLEPHFRSQPWPPLPPDSLSGSEFRMTPPEFGRGRESTPPRGRHSTIIDGETGPRQSSPLGGEMRDSRNSTPPHSLPDFHDIPPPPRPFFPPPGVHPRYPLPPPFSRRELSQGTRRTENQSDSGSSIRGAQQPVPPDNWQQSNSRV